MKKILFFGNGAQINYVNVKYLRKYSSFKPDLLLQDYNSIYDHPAWEDVPVKIPQETVTTNPKEAFNQLKEAMEKNNWKMEEWIHEHPIKFSFYDKFTIKYFDKSHIIKKRINHYVNDMKKYDFVISDVFGSISAFLAKVPYAVRPYGSDIDIHAFENNFRGQMMRKALLNAKAIYSRPYQKNLKKLGIPKKPELVSVIIDTNNFKPRKVNNKIKEFFLASRADFSLKGTDKAIKAFAKLLQSYDAHLFCLEFGSDVKKTHELVETLGINKHVTFYNFVASKPVLAELYNKHDAIIGNLSYGTIGHTELDAMSCNKTIIAYSKLETDYDKELPILNSFTEGEIYNNMKKVCENRNLPTGMRDFVIKHFNIDKLLNGLNSFVELYK